MVPMATNHWPLFDLRIVTEHLVLRPISDDDFDALIEAIDAGIHDPDQSTFRSSGPTRNRFSAPVTRCSTGGGVAPVARQPTGPSASVSGWKVASSAYRRHVHLGYHENGRARHLDRGEAAETIRFMISRAEFAARAFPTIRVENLEPCLPMFGL